MRNIALNMVTAFIMSMLVGYWMTILVRINNVDPTPVIHSLSLKPFLQFANIDEEQAIEIKFLKHSFIASFVSNFSAWDANKIFNFAEPLQTVLKTDTQKEQFLYVLHQLEEYQLPHELALIPIIESQYKSQSLSRKGAAGVWQLMPITAKSHGLLKQQRYEIEPSTQAALIFLKELHHQFGNWELAIAAYNAGSKRVHYALKKNPTAKNIKELNLPLETKKYINSFYEMMAYLQQ